MAPDRIGLTGLAHYGPFSLSIETMRYNPDTDRGISIDAIAEQCRNAVQNVEVVREYQVKLPKTVWDCQKGHWTLVNA